MPPSLHPLNSIQWTYPEHYGRRMNIEYCMGKSIHGHAPINSQDSHFGHMNQQNDKAAVQDLSTPIHNHQASVPQITCVNQPRKINYMNEVQIA